jgi:hypothetical protein
MVTRYLEGRLFGLPPLDTPMFIAAPLVFVIVGAVAALVAAWSATMADPDPVRAIRAE